MKTRLLYDAPDGFNSLQVAEKTLSLRAAGFVLQNIIVRCRPDDTAETLAARWDAVYERLGSGCHADDDA